MKLLDMIADELGYIPKYLHNNKQLYQRREYENKLQKMESEKIDVLVSAIRSVRMVKAVFEGPTYARWFEYPEDEGVSARVETIDPPKSSWYSYRVNLDMGAMQRIYQDLSMGYDSYEFEYLKRSVLREIEYNFDALIRMEFGVEK